MNPDEIKDETNLLQDAIVDDLTNLKNLCTDMLNYGIEMIAPPPNYDSENQIKEKISEIKNDINEMVNEYKQIIDELCKVIEQQNSKIEQQNSKIEQQNIKIEHYNNKLKEHENVINQQNEKINTLVKENKHLFEKELEKEWDLHPYSQNGLITFHLNNKSFAVNTQNIDNFRNLLKTVLNERKRLVEKDLIDMIESTKIPQFIKSFSLVQSRVLPLPFHVMEKFSKENKGFKSEMSLCEDTKYIYTLCTITW
jgi:small-conductance mechanosensitive channel